MHLDVHLKPLMFFAKVVGLLAPAMRSSSGEAVALSIAVPMSVVFDTLLDDAQCRGTRWGFADIWVKTEMKQASWVVVYFERPQLGVH